MITRRNYGSGHAYQVNGKPYPGVTTILRQQAAPALIGWSARTTAEYAVDNWDELAGLKVSERLRLITGASTSERDAAGRRGTQVHRLAEQIISLPPGEAETVEVPEELAGHVDSYLSFMADHQPELVVTELVVCNRRVRYCGSADLVAVIGGHTWLLEIKTSKGLRSGSALQACAYQHAETYTLPGEQGTERPMSELGIDRAGVVHVRADGYDLIPLDTGPVTWDYFRRLAWLHYHAEHAERWVGEAVQPARVLAS